MGAELRDARSDQRPGAQLKPTMLDEMYPWEENPTPYEEWETIPVPDDEDDTIPCCECLCFETPLCNFCTQKRYE